MLDMPADLRGARPAFPHHEGRVGLPSLQAGAEPAPLVPFQLFSLVRDAKRRLAGFLAHLRGNKLERH